MIVGGIDPGLTGAIAAISTEDLHVVDVIDMPFIDHDLDWPLFREFMEEWDVKEFWLEKAGAMAPAGRKQGGTSMFNYGCGYGQLIGALKACAIPYTLIRPQTWKQRELRDMPKEKASSVVRVNQLYPALKLKKSHHGKADAILIARYGAGISAGGSRVKG